MGLKRQAAMGLAQRLQRCQQWVLSRRPNFRIIRKYLSTPPFELQEVGNTTFHSLIMDYES